ncbi:MAG: HIT domain-containing protein [Acidimicrobiales bacterium]
MVTGPDVVTGPEIATGPDTGLGRLWAGWRGAYVAGTVDAHRAGTTGDYQAAEAVTGVLGPGQIEECVLCRVTSPANDDATANVVQRGTFCVAILNAYPYTSGHLMVVPSRHVGEVEDLSGDESAELWEMTRSGIAALKSAYRPGGVNIGANLGRAAGAGVPGHLHMHVLPRWDGDTNFMTTVAETRVLPEALFDTWARLRSAWPS